MRRSGSGLTLASHDVAASRRLGRKPTGRGADRARRDHPNVANAMVHRVQRNTERSRVQAPSGASLTRDVDSLRLSCPGAYHFA